MIGVGTSFLVGLAVREHPSHAACLSLFEREIRGRGGSMALSGQVLAEFCHVITDLRRFQDPLDMSDALELCEMWWNTAECGGWPPPNGAISSSTVCSTWSTSERYAAGCHARARTDRLRPVSGPRRLRPRARSGDACSGDADGRVHC